MMKTALLDIGSNTIRLVVYQPEGGALNPVYESKENARLISLVQVGRLPEAGIRQLSQWISQMKAQAEEQGAQKLCCFSTASLRGIQNQREVLDAVEKSCGVRIHALSGEQEALCDFEGLKAAAGTPALIGCDLGGGSAQIFSSGSEGLQWWASLPIGCLKMTNEYVEGFLPTAEEESQLRSAVRQQLLSQPRLYENSYDTLYLTGGSARAALRLAQNLLGQQTKLVPREGLRQLIRRLRDENENVRALLTRYVPGREEIILPGMMVLDEISHAAGVKQLSVEEYGVREGYLIRHVLKNR